MLPSVGDDRYDGSFIADGRLAFYLKGKIQGPGDAVNKDQSTALPQPPNTNQNVPMHSAASRLVHLLIERASYEPHDAACLRQPIRWKRRQLQGIRSVLGGLPSIALRKRNRWPGDRPRPSVDSCLRHYQRGR